MPSTTSPSGSKQHWRDRIPKACKGYDTQSDALDRAIAECLFFLSSHGGRYISRRLGVENTCMTTNIMITLSSYIRTYHVIFISQIFKNTDIIIILPPFLSTYKKHQRTYFFYRPGSQNFLSPQNPSPVTWPHAPRFHAIRWTQKSWRQWRDVRPLFVAHSWHEGTLNSRGISNRLNHGWSTYPP